MAVAREENVFWLMPERASKQTDADLVRVIPISPKSVQISAVRAGVTQVNVWDSEGKVNPAAYAIHAGFARNGRRAAYPYVACSFVDGRMDG